MKRIGFIGGGAMAEAIIKGLVAQGVTPANLYVSDKSQERLRYLENTLSINPIKNNQELVSQADVIILAVKPQNMNEAVESIANTIKPKLLISILAGTPLAKIEKLLPAEVRVIRAMPNTPALVRAGTTVLAGGSAATRDDLTLASEIFQAVGSVNILPENLLNAVTGLSGSGPAYVYMIIEALTDGGVLAGLPRDVALQLAVDTIQGAAKMVAETKLHPGQLKDMVTSPGGTTIYGLHRLEQAGVRGAIMETVLRATQRAEELG